MTTAHEAAGDVAPHATQSDMPISMFLLPFAFRRQATTSDDNIPRPWAI